jgi:hypothetical protein
MGSSSNQVTQTPAGISQSVGPENIFVRAPSPLGQPNFSPAPAPAAPSGGAGIFGQSANAYSKAVAAAQNAAKFKFNPIQGGGGGGAVPVAKGYEVTPLEAQKLSAVDYAPYMNPYTQDVIERSEQDIARQRDSALNALGAQASAANAFGGSRFGLSEGETYGQFGRAAADIAAQQRQAGFEMAQQAAQFDIGSQFEAQKQTELMRQAAAENAANRAQSAAAASASRAGATAMANQQAQLNAAKLQLSAAGQLGGLAQMGQGMGMNVQQAIGQQGALQRSIQQQLLDAQRQRVNQATGAPLAGLGTLSQTLSSTPYGQTTTASRSPGIFDFLSVASGLGARF